MQDKICLLGANGFIGSAIAEQLDRENMDWVGIDKAGNARPNVYTLAMEETQQVVSLFSEYPTVINAVGSLKPLDFDYNFEESMETFWHLIQGLESALLRSKVEAVLHISSGGTVYGESPPGGSRESDELNPKSWYGRTKVIEEWMLSRVSQKKRIRLLCARVMNPYGKKGKEKHGFIDVLVNTALSGGKFQTFFPPNAHRDFIHVHDLSRILIQLLQVGASGVYNVGTGVSTRLQDLFDYVDSQCPELSVHASAEVNESQVVINHVSITKLEKTLGPIEFKDLYDHIDEQIATGRRIALFTGRQ